MDAAKVSASKLTELLDPSGARGAGASGSKSFANEMGEALANANDELNQAEASARELAAGKGDVVETMIALGRADVSLRMVVNMRNRILESYQEIMRLQV